MVERVIPIMQMSPPIICVNRYFLFRNSLLNTIALGIDNDCTKYMNVNDVYRKDKTTKNRPSTATNANIRYAQLGACIVCIPKQNDLGRDDNFVEY